MSADLDYELSTTLYQSAHTRVRRIPSSHKGGTIICKESLGRSSLARLSHERRIIERLSTIEGVVRLAVDAYPDNVLAIEDAGGVDLGRLFRSSRMELPDLFVLSHLLANILSEVHKAGVLHKDISPANILLAGPQRRPILIDFDLAITSTEEQPAFTHHREIAGTLAYMAPEQTGRSGRMVDQRADLYGLGATLYELAVGHPPFVANDPLRLIHDHLARVPAPPVDLVPQIPRAYSDIVMRLLEKDPDQRYQSAQGLANDLSRLLVAIERGDTRPFPLGTHDFASRLSAPSRLIGRDAETATLIKTFDDAVAGGGSCVLVTGAAGVGKTSLINELRPIVTARRGWMISGKFDQYRHDAPSATIQALRTLGRMLLAEPEDQVAAQRLRILQTLGANAGLATAVLPEFELLLGAQPDVVAVGPAEAETRLLLGTVDFIRAIASPERPVVMVLDDLQWAPALSIRFIDAVLSDQKLSGFMLVGAFRDTDIDETHPLSVAQQRWARLKLEPRLLQLRNLPPPSLEIMVAGMLRLTQNEAASLSHALSAHTNGNPYDTVEMINELRRDGSLTPGDNGWAWNPVTIRGYIGHHNVVDLLRTRIARLPLRSRLLLESTACIGGEIALSFIQIATGLSATELEADMAALLDDGLLVLEKGDHSALRIRHDRVQQAVHSSLDHADRIVLHLTLARRMAAFPELLGRAVEQYLSATDAIQDADECVAVAELFLAAANRAHTAANYLTAERLLAAGITLLTRAPAMDNSKLMLALETGWHGALYSLGKLTQADEVFQSIVARCQDPLSLADVACTQISSLSSRRQHRQAMELGLRILAQLGMQPPDDMPANILARFTVLADSSEIDPAQDLLRPDVTDIHVLTVARVINRIMAPAYYGDRVALAWLVLESHDLWQAHGPCTDLVATLCATPLVTVATRQDYRSGYAMARRALKVGEARGFEPGTSWGRHCSSFFSQHWFEPLEEVTFESRRAREGLLRGGDLQVACITYFTTLTTLLDSAPTVDVWAEEAEVALAFAARSGNDQTKASFLVFRQLALALRGATNSPGSFNDVEFSEQTHLTNQAANPVSKATFHICRAIAAAIFRDEESLWEHTVALMPLEPLIHCQYNYALTRLMRAVALAHAAKNSPSDQAAAMLAECDDCLAWLATRATDAPANFLHLLKFAQAERAWAAGDFQGAICAFDAALSECRTRCRPWQNALIAERAGLFHLAHDLEHTGRMLLFEAKNLYENWGASAKVLQLENAHPSLNAARAPWHDLHTHRSVRVSSSSIDMLAILRTSQALSSETNLQLLKTRIVELLGTLTGATDVKLVLRRDEPEDWFLTAVGTNTDLSVQEAGKRGLLPLSAFLYAQRTQAPLLVDDAMRDERFASDLYFSNLEQCSLLVVPILSLGIPRAILLLENTLGRGAFSVDRLDAVMLMAGQLTVSLDNALLYDSLETKVEERTRALERANQQLEISAETLRQLSDIGRDITANLDAAAVFKALDGHVHALLDITHLLVLMLDEAGANLDCVFGVEHGTSISSMQVVLDEAARCMAERCEILTDATGNAVASTDAECTLPVISRLFVPLTIGDRISGVVMIQTVRRKAYFKREQLIFRTLCAYSAIALDNAAAYRQLEATLMRLRETQAQLVQQEKMASLGTLTAGVAHEINNPANFAHVGAQVLRQNLEGFRTFLVDIAADDADSDIIQSLNQHVDALAIQTDTIVEGTTRIKNLVLDLLMFARLDGQSKESVPVVDSLLSTINLVRTRYVETTEIRCELDANPVIACWPALLNQVFMNIIVNACQATQKTQANTGEQRAGLLTVRNRIHDDRWLAIEFDDNGCGIPDDVIDHIFEPFFTTKMVGQGTGLGLSISFGIVEKHGGHMKVRSIDGEGTCVTVMLPLK